MNKRGVSRRWFTEADVKDFKNTALRIVKNITRSMVNWKRKKNSFTGAFVDRFGTTYFKN